MHVKAKKLAFGGLLLALTVICMVLGSVIESSTLFLLAAASFFVGIVIRETGLLTGAAFYLAGVLLGFMLAPNKLYVLTYAAMAFYILVIEFSYGQLGKLPAGRNRRHIFWMIKYMVFNLMFLPAILFFPKLFIPAALPGILIVVIILAGQVILFLYDKAYEYTQVHIWNKLRGRF